MILEGCQGTKQIAKSIDAMYLEWQIITKDKWLSSPASNPIPSHPQYSQQVPLRFCAPERLTSPAAQQDMRLELL